jgi:hypothetical protein
MTARGPTSDTTTRVVLFANALVWLPYGLLGLLRPSTLADVAALGLASPTAIVEVQAMYGGLEIAIGVLALWGALRPRSADAAIWSLLVLSCGLVGGRALGLITSGDRSGYNLGALAFELTGAASAAWAYASLRRSDAGAAR